ncbi:MAG: arylsulfatase [Bacteroidales bacterium]
MRYTILINFTLIALIPLVSCGNQGSKEVVTPQPNVIFVITDDQGYGDLGVHGNHIIQTPNLDMFYENSVRFTNYHVSPTCAPTRGALMTGRYTNRTNTHHTIAGRSQLFRDEKIIAEIFSENDYITGMFGKWHLGDNYPFRPEDRGFQEVVRHGGGGITQGPDYWGNDYFDDTYWHNGTPRKFEGYCTDVFFNEALKFIEKNKDQPFFCYISTNAPHAPLHVPLEYYNLYKNDETILENQKRFYGMITNIDDNFQRLENKLEQLDIRENTILIFMTDNGTAFGVENKDGKMFGHDGGLRGKKASIYDGGHRVPFFIRWPAGNVLGGKDIDKLTAHIDILPTLVELCELKFEEKKPIDGRSLAPLFIEGYDKWEERILVVDNQRVQNLVKFRNYSVMDETWRLINGEELYNIEQDRKQSNNIAYLHPEIVNRLSQAYNKWWESIMNEGVGEKHAYIEVGTSYENPVRISAHDMHTGFLGRAWHQYGALEADQGNGILKVEFSKGGRYKISLCRYPRSSGLSINEDVQARVNTVEVNNPMPASKYVNFINASIYLADIKETKSIKNNDTEVVFEITIPEGKYDMEVFLTDDKNRIYPSYYTYIEKL